MIGKKIITLNGATIGNGHPCYFIAEIAGNFMNEVEAARIVDGAVRAGAHAVKFQTLDADTITTRSNRFDMDSVGTRLQYDVFREAQTPAELQRFVIRYCKERGITAFSAPSHLQDLELMHELDMPAWKIGSDLATHIPLLREVARTGKPIFLSTGMCTMEEVERSVEAILQEGNDNLLLFHCVSNYPGRPEEQNLRAMLAMKERFRIPVGFSDHVRGIAVSLAAVALGADMIERHFWCEGNFEGSDRGISSDESEFTLLTQGAVDLRLALGNGCKEPSAAERNNLLTNRVSIIVMQDCAAGTVLTPDLLDIRRPGYGLSPGEWDKVLGRTLCHDVPAETPLKWDMIVPCPPINKGNYNSMETPEREHRFEKLRGAGWEEEYKQYRRDWRELPARQEVREYPLLLDIELTTLCNLACPMCFTTTEKYSRDVKRQHMDFSLYKRLVDEAAGNVCALRLSLRGESTLHPRFIECIRFAKQNGIREVSFLTNLSTMTHELFKEIAEAGADWITVSIDGMNEEYEKVRHPLRFSDTLEKIRMMHRFKLENWIQKPVIKVQTLWPAIRKNPEQFYETFAPYTDLVAFNPLIDYLGKDTDVVYMDDFLCPQLYQRLLICSDGKAIMCSNDEYCAHQVGDANHESIYNIWHGETLNSIRELHKKPYGFKQLDLCRHCYLPRRTEDSETAVVHGRVFHIHNYLNRSQIIGT